ncbi:MULTISPECIES: TIGR00341 family protein [unclassified Streptomyces]|uniref:TIGR00341 family protein n=1 Tax=unclassified Streptomyces TaxID=2593676 RepID=UPI0035DDFFF7
MLSSLRDRVLPDHQRRTLEELEEDLDLSAGDIRAKQSAFWSMLFLAAVIAAGGVLTDSTATVIGAMIVAPLSTPIMGIALGAVQRRRSTAALFVGAGGLLVVVLGALFSLVLPSSYDLLSNSQISSRTSPGLMDLVAALATGFAGALALARRDVAAVLPGVAIAISLVPPLVVTGVCLGQTAWWLALGSFVLFVSNLLALVFAGMAVFGGLGYAKADHVKGAGAVRRTYVALGLLFAAVGVLLVANTAATVLVQLWTTRATNSATEWLAASPGASVVNVSAQSRTLYIQVRAPGDLPPVETLLADLEGQIPDGVPVVVVTNEGRKVQAGRIGD